MSRTLIIKTSSMGDILHTLPALTDAQQALPEMRFDWVVEESFADIPSWHPAVDKVIPIALRRWRKSSHQPQTRQEWRQFKQQLQRQHYDYVIDAQGLLKSAFFITRLARGSKHGPDWHSAREHLASLFYQHRHTVNPQQHAVERMRLLLAQSLAYPKPETIGDYAIAAHFQSHSPSTIAPYLVFLHGTSREEKCYPEAQWQQLLQLCQPLGFTIKLPWGNQAEYQRANRLAAGKPYVEVLDKSSLTAMATILAQAQAIVSVDTGLSHLAAALDKTNITLFGPTDPKLIGGYGKNQYAYCAPNGQLSQLAAQQVYQQLYQQLLARK